MECLTPSVSCDIFMVAISDLFVCLPILELTTFEQHVCSTQIGYANECTIIGDKQLQENGRFEQCTSSHKAV